MSILKKERKRSKNAGRFNGSGFIQLFTFFGYLFFLVPCWRAVKFAVYLNFMNKLLALFLLLFFLGANHIGAQSLSVYQNDYKAGKFENLGKRLDSLQRCCPSYNQSDPDAWTFLYANTKMKLGKFSEAKGMYESIGFKPEDYPLNYGICLIKNNLFEEAFKQLNDYYSSHEEDYKATYWLGESYYHLQKPKEAIRVLQRAVDAFPEDPDAYYLMGIIYSEKGDYEKSFLFFQAAYDTKPTFFEAKFNMGMAKYYAQQMEAAEEVFSELALEKIKNLPEVLMILGEIRYRLHDEEGACEYWKEADGYGHPEAKEQYNKVCIDKKGNAKFHKKSFVSF
jgi:TolA-binding protein